MIQTILTILLAAPCVLADTSSEPAASRRTFSIDVSFTKPEESEQRDSPQQSQLPAAPVTSINYGNGQSWQPSAPALLEPKGPPPFLPDDQNAVVVAARNALPTTVTTTVAPQTGMFQAAMPLVSGVQNMVGQAETGAKNLLHLPSDGKKGQSAGPMNAALKAETSQAQFRLKIAQRQEAELKAKLAKVNAKLNMGSSQPTAQQSQPQQASPEQSLPLARPQPTAPAPEQAVAQQTQQATAAPPQQTTPAPPQQTTPAPPKQTTPAPPKETTFAQLQETTAASPKETTRTWTQPPQATAAPTKKASSTESAQATQKTSPSDDDKARLSGLAAALRGSQGKSSAEMKRLYTASPVRSTLGSQANVVTLGSAVVAVAALLAVVARFVSVRRQATEDAYESEDSGIE